MRLADKHIMRKGYGNDAPFINQNSTQCELMKYFSWCGYMIDKKVLIDEFFDTHKDLDKSQYVESSILAINYGMNRDIDFPHVIRMKYFTKISGMKKVNNSTTPKQEPSKVIRINEKQSKFIASVEDMIDNKIDFDLVEFAKENEVDVHTCNILRQNFNRMLDEYIQAKNKSDPQLTEAYKSFGAKKLSNLINQYETLIDALDEYVGAKNKQRKPRKKKVRTPEMILKHFTCMEEYGNIKSIKPEKILNSSYLWVFDTKYKKLTMFVAKEGETFGVHRTAITNYDPEKTVCKRVGRKEKEILDLILNTTPAKRKKILSTVKTSKIKIPERINNCVVLLHAGK